MNATDAAVDLAMAQLPLIPGSGVRAGTYTPAGGVPIAANGAVFLREEPRAGVQRRSGTVLLLQREIVVEPTDGATFLFDAITWTIRTALRQVSLWRCEAWA